MITTEFFCRLGRGDGTVGGKRLDRADRRQNDRKPLSHAEHVARSIDRRHVAQHPWPECQGFDGQPIAHLCRFGFRTAGQVIPCGLRQVQPCLMDELVQRLVVAFRVQWIGSGASLDLPATIDRLPGLANSEALLE